MEEDSTTLSRSWRNLFVGNSCSSGNGGLCSSNNNNNNNHNNSGSNSGSCEMSLTESSRTAPGTTERRYSSPTEQKQSTSSTRRRRRPDRHTIDTTRTDVVTKSNSKINNNHEDPLQEEPQKKSLLMRFLASTSRRRSVNSGGSTVSRLTDDEPDLPSSSDVVVPSSSIPPSRRATMDMDLSGRKTVDGSPPNRSHSSSSGGVGAGGGTGVGGITSNSEGPRRATMDMAFTTSNRSITNILSPQFRADPREEYISTQAKLQKRADDLHKGGRLKEAIDVWLEALTLAETNKDTLTCKMEIMCILVDLHLQVSQQYKEGENHSNPEVAEREVRFHRQAAKRYVHRLKPAIVKASWLGPPSVHMMDFFCEAEAWELALLVAQQLVQEDLRRRVPPIKPSVCPHQLATMHFQVASQKLDNNRQGEALQHLQATVEHLKVIPAETRDMTMYLQVLQLLATEYNSQGQHALALDAYQEQVRHAPADKQASMYCQMAQIYLATERLDEALEKLQLAAAHVGASESSIRFELLQAKGDVYYRLGRMDESLEVYEQALEEVSSRNPAETAKLLYTLGRLCVRLHRIRPAISYFSRELDITIAELGMNHMSVSRVLHELAKLYDEYLGEHKTALMKLNKALSVELSVLQECHFAITQCANCNPITHRMCARHAQIQHDVSAQIRETKKCQGRIHFKLGNFEKALKTSFNEKSSGRR